MSDTRSTFSTVGAAAPDAVNDHPTLRFAHLTPERVVNAGAAERLELRRLCLEAGARSLAAELERWAQFASSPLALAPPAVRATYSPEQRLELANYCGPDDARTCPMDTGRLHAPIAERATRTDNKRRGWIVASENAGALSWFLTLNRIGGPQAIPSHELRIGWDR